MVKQKINTNEIIERRISLFNKLIKAMELRKKVEKQIKDYRNEMWGLDNYCFQKWKDKK